MIKYKYRSCGCELSGYSSCLHGHFLMHWLTLFNALIGTYMYCLLGARRVLMLFNIVPLRARRVLPPKTLYSDSALLVLNGTLLSGDNTLLALNCFFAEYHGWAKLHYTLHSRVAARFWPKEYRQFSLVWPSQNRSCHADLALSQNLSTTLECNKNVMEPNKPLS